MMDIIPAWIIDKIQREEEQQRIDQQPSLYIYDYDYYPQDPPADRKDDTEVIIAF